MAKNQTVAQFVRENHKRDLRFEPARLPPEFNAEDDKRRVVESECHIGIEIEAENYLGFNPDVAIYDKLFEIAPEGSLRNNGIEFKIPPVKGQNIVFYLNVLDKLNKSMELKYNDLTGLHVHMNMQKSTLQQVANFLSVYLIFEPALFKFSGGRDSSIYCNPLQCSSSGVDYALQLQLMDAIRRGKKYMALNYLPLTKFGTIEFRHSAGTDDTTAILNWVNLLLRMWNFAHEQDYEKLKKRIHDLTTKKQFEEFAREIFKEQLELFSIPHLWNTMPEGIAFVKQCYAPTATLKILDTVVKMPRAVTQPKKPLPKEQDPWLDMEGFLENPPNVRPVNPAGLEAGAINVRPGFQIIDDIIPNEGNNGRNI